MITNNFKIFIVEDDPWYGEWLSHQLLLNPDYEVVKFTTAKDCISQLDEQPQVVTLDYSLPDINGAEALKKIKQVSPQTEVIVISAQEKINTAVELLQQGAFDYIVKDNEARDRLLNTVQNIRKNKSLQNEVEQLRKEVSTKYNSNKTLIGKSDLMKKVFVMIDKAARTQITVSITGETGTGKELVAKAIHYQSERSKKSFVPVNVASIPRELLESELFGHEKGAFTGAHTRRVGKFEEAQGGTLFLDEIADLDISLQAKLLRVLQEKEISRVGSNQLIKLNVRIIVATHKNLNEEVRKGNFREDLFYRLFGLPIQLPPLRERGDDIIELAYYFLKEFCKENKTSLKQFSEHTKEKLLTYRYPGNIRELKAIVEYAAVMTEGEHIGDENILLSNSGSDTDFLHNESTMEEYNHRILKHFLKKYNNDVLTVADKLGLGKSTVYRMLKNKAFN